MSLDFIKATLHNMPENIYRDKVIFSPFNFAYRFTSEGINWVGNKGWSSPLKPLSSLQEFLSGAPLPWGLSGTVCLWPVIDNATQAAQALVSGAWSSLRSGEAGRSAVGWSSVLSLSVERMREGREGWKEGKQTVIHIKKEKKWSNLSFHTLENDLTLKI